MRRLTHVSEPLTLRIGMSEAMGQVMDNDLRVYVVYGLRMVDARIFPVPVGGHPQATLYALTGQAGDTIHQDL